MVLLNNETLFSTKKKWAIMLLEGKQIHRSMKQKWEPRSKLHIYGQLIYTENQRTYKRKNVCLVTQLYPTLWDPMDCRGFSRQEYWSMLPCPPPGNLPDPGIEPWSPTLQVDSLPSKPPGKPKNTEVGSLYLLQGIVSSINYTEKTGQPHAKEEGRKKPDHYFTL